MGFTDAMRRFFGLPSSTEELADESTVSIQTNLPSHTQWLEWSGLYPISLGGAMGIPGVLQANGIITDLGSQIPLTQQRRIVEDGQVRWERIPTPAAVIRRPNPLEPVEETMRVILAGMAGGGEKYLITTARDTAGRPIAVKPVPSSDVTIRNGEYFYQGTRQRPWSDIWHLTYFRIDGQQRGIGPIQAYALNLQGSDTVEAWTRNYFSKGGQFQTHIHSRDDLDENDAQQLKKDWIESRGGLLEPAVTSGDLEVKLEHLDADKAQALDTRKWNLQMVASMYRLNPYLLAASMSGSSITYQTLPDLAAEAIRLTIYPGYLRKIETVFSEMLPYGHRARFDLREFLRADEKTRMETAKTAIEAGVLTPDEVRADEGRRPRGATSATRETEPAPTS